MSGNQPGNATGNILGPDTGELSPHLIARFYTVIPAFSQDGTKLFVRDGQIEVHVPVIDADIEYALNWQSPFENMSPDQARPALAAMLQSGAIQPFVNAAIGALPESVQGLARDLVGGESLINQFQGKTGITKLNSTQVFSGMPPVKFTMQLHFRAWADPEREVEAPFRQLRAWALPQKLAQDGLATNLLRGKGFLASMFPSTAPTMVGMIFGGCRYQPLVIESLGEPLSGPRERDSKRIDMVVPVTLASLTALDRDDAAAFGNLAERGKLLR